MFSPSPARHDHSQGVTRECSWGTLQSIWKGWQDLMKPSQMTMEQTLKMDECCMLACFLRPGVISCDLAAALLANHHCRGCAYVCFIKFYVLCLFFPYYVVFTIVQLIFEFGFCITNMFLQCDVCGSLNFCWYIPKVAPVTGFTHEVIHCWGLLRKVWPFLLASTCFEHP